jgi:uncharacterized membrane protein
LGTASWDFGGRRVYTKGHCLSGSFQLASPGPHSGYHAGPAHIALAGITVLSSWAFIQVMFALHYAHEYYAAVCHGRTAVLSFPGTEDPDYGEFFNTTVLALLINIGAGIL